MPLLTHRYFRADPAHSAGRGLRGAIFALLSVVAVAVLIVAVVQFPRFDEEKHRSSSSPSGGESDVVTEVEQSRLSIPLRSSAAAAMSRPQLSGQSLPSRSAEPSHFFTPFINWVSRPRPFLANDDMTFNSADDDEAVADRRPSLPLTSFVDWISSPRPFLANDDMSYNFADDDNEAVDSRRNGDTPPAATQRRKAGIYTFETGKGTCFESGGNPGPVQNLRTAFCNTFIRGGTSSEKCLPVTFGPSCMRRGYYIPVEIPLPKWMLPSIGNLRGYSRGGTRSLSPLGSLFGDGGGSHGQLAGVGGI